MADIATTMSQITHYGWKETGDNITAVLPESLPPAAKEREVKAFKEAVISVVGRAGIDAVTFDKTTGELSLDTVQARKMAAKYEALPPDAPGIPERRDFEGKFKPIFKAANTVLAEELVTAVEKATGVKGKFTSKEIAGEGPMDVISFPVRNPIEAESLSDELANARNRVKPKISSDDLGVLVSKDKTEVYIIRNELETLSGEKRERLMQQFQKMNNVANLSSAISSATPQLDPRAVELAATLHNNPKHEGVAITGNAPISPGSRAL